jgi:DNA-binding PadR family transcriptional regulator
MLSYAILAILAEGPAHGYALQKRLAARLPTWRPNIGQVYQVLAGLERTECVVGQEERHGRRLRMVYALTPRGERKLATWLGRRPAASPPLREEVLVRVLAAHRAGPEAMAAQLDRQIVLYTRAADDLRTLPTDDELGADLRDAEVAVVEALLAWCVRLRDRLRQPRLRVVG